MAKKFPNTQFAITDYPVRGPAVLGQEGQAAREEHHGHHLQVGAAELPGRLPLRPDGEEGRRQHDQRDGRRQDPAGRLVHRRLQGGRGQVRARAPRCWSATRRTSSRRTSARRWPQNQIAAGSKVVFAVAGPCGFGALAAAKEAGRLGRRRRRRPVIPRPAHPDERGQAGRSRRLPLRPGGQGRHARRRATTSSSISRTAASRSARSARRCRRRTSRGSTRSRRRSSPARSRSRRTF